MVDKVKAARVWFVPTSILDKLVKATDEACELCKSDKRNVLMAMGETDKENEVDRCKNCCVKDYRKRLIEQYMGSQYAFRTSTF